MDELRAAAEKLIRAQQGPEGSTVWNVGEQLLDMMDAQPEIAALLAQDLPVKGMGLADCEKKIKALADERNRKNGGMCAGVSGREADGIIRKFYGLPENTSSGASRHLPLEGEGLIDLTEFF